MTQQERLIKRFNDWVNQIPDKEPDSIPYSPYAMFHQLFIGMVFHNRHTNREYDRWEVYDHINGNPVEVERLRRNEHDMIVVKHKENYACN